MSICDHLWFRLNLVRTQTCFRAVAPFRRSIASFCLVTLFVSSVNAETNWINPDQGNWFDSNNWSNGVPAFNEELRSSGWENELHAFINNGGTSIIAGSSAGADVLHVGSNSTGHLQITNSGSLTSFQTLLAEEADSEATVLVTGAGTVWDSSRWLFGTIIGGAGHATLTIEDGGQVTSNGLGAIILGESDGSTGTASVSDAGSKWVLDAETLIGNRGTGKLTVTNGAEVSTGSEAHGTHIAKEAGSLGVVDISGEGTKVTLSRINLGEKGEGELTVSDGGELISLGSYAVIATESGSKGTMTIKGNGSLFDNYYGVVVGDKGDGSLTITNGGMINSGGGYVGRRPESHGSVIVTGQDSKFISGGLYIGYEGNADVSIEKGGQLSTGRSTIAEKAGSKAMVEIDGPHSSWTSTEYLGIAQAGSAKVNITNGGLLTSDSASVGSDGQVKIDGTNSAWKVKGALSVTGPTVEIEVTNRGTLTAGGTSIAIGAGSAGKITVTGNGSTWNSGDLGIGGTYNSSVSGGAGTVTISDGAKLNSKSLSVATGPSANSALIVKNAGSMVESSGEVRVAGSNDNKGTMSVTDGAKVKSVTGSIALGRNSVGKATIDGSGSSWENTGKMTVGNNGSAELLIINGGKVSNALATVGSQAFSNSSVTVSGPESTWTNSASLTIGEYGIGELNVTGEGKVSNTLGFIGYRAGSSGKVAITGRGSSWTNDGKLTVGDRGSGELTISGGATVTSKDAVVGIQYLSVGKVLVTGEASTWTNTGSLTLGSLGTSEVTIANGGLATIDGSAIVRRAALRLDQGTLVCPDLIISSDALFTNNGTFQGDLSAEFGGLITGSGLFEGTVTIGADGIFSPGNSPGSVSTSQTVWNEGGSYRWEINSLELFADEGTNPGWDFWNVGELLIAGPFNIDVTSLMPDNELGLLDSWDPSRSYSWRIATSDNHAFASLDQLSIDTSHFQNSLAGGRFTLSSLNDGKDLYLNFVTVPEPTTFILAGFGCIALGFVSRYQRRKVEKSL